MAMAKIEKGRLMQNIPSESPPFDILIATDRPHDAFALFLEEIDKKDFAALLTHELEMFQHLCLKTVPQLCRDYTLWLARHRDHMRRMLSLLNDALKAGFLEPAATANIASLRCLLAIVKAMDGALEAVHKELCLAGGALTIPLPKPDKEFREQLQRIQWTESTSIDLLKAFFDSYMDFVRTAGQPQLANNLHANIRRLLEAIERDEHRCGIVRALFHDKIAQDGLAAYVHVRLKRLSDSTGNGHHGDVITYVGSKQDHISCEMEEAAQATRQVVDCYLKRHDLYDGLDAYRVLWEIGSVDGDQLVMGRKLEGASIALPLAIAIVSAYLERPVPNDTAFTGAFSPVGLADGELRPVDGIDRKLRYAAKNGCKVACIPAANTVHLDNRPVLQSLLQNHNTTVVGAESLDNVCEQIFPPIGSGRMRDIMRDTLLVTADVLRLRHHVDTWDGNQAIGRRHRKYILGVSAATAVLIMLETMRLYKAFAPDYPAAWAWLRIGGSASTAFVVVLGSCAMALATLRHTKRWGWFGIMLSSLLWYAATVAITASMLPRRTEISHMFNSPPLAGLLKDLLVVWFFAAVFAGDVLCVVAALEHLLDRRQFITARQCLRWASQLEARMPIWSVYFSWEKGLVGMAIAVVILLASLLYYLYKLNYQEAGAFAEAVLVIVQAAVFLIAITLILAFYKSALAEIRLRMAK